MFYNLLKSKDSNPGNKASFSDVTADNWAHDAIGAASYYGWIGGYEDGTFKPTASIARSEAVRVVNAILARSADKAAVDADKALVTFSDVES